MLGYTLLTLNKIEIEMYIQLNQKYENIGSQ